ncbi:hypothetical protein C9374_009538 [Naegleria lovaniensis]|uniref:Uncharacterized protein n=1 Tax=Naegleria lovaniensis TaxID=51637 RepID=A0AA88KR23_NAELO|nr:uncharacterized protein C9374_009538 [Naegleria lovaniensis]KAG2392961.1 hypothetical protein C9374_009538 [Naegleria lovaniensis]
MHHSFSHPNRSLLLGVVLLISTCTLLLLQHTPYSLVHAQVAANVAASAGAAGGGVQAGQMAAGATLDKFTSDTLLYKDKIQALMFVPFSAYSNAYGPYGTSQRVYGGSPYAPMGAYYNTYGYPSAVGAYGGGGGAYGAPYGVQNYYGYSPYYYGGNYYAAKPY